MRWLLGRDPGDCATCGAELERGASWCGACGARADDGAGDGDATPPSGAGTDPVAVAEADATAVPVRDGVWGRRATAGLVLLVLGGLVAAQVLRDAPAEALLGTVGVATGTSASGPPPDGLGVAWERELVVPGDEPVGLRRGSPEVAATDDRIRVGERVVDRDTGRLVRVVRSGTADAGTRAQVVGDELVVVDTMTGDVRSRAALDATTAELLRGQDWASARSGGVSLFATGPDEVALVDDDGEVVAQVEGTPAHWVDRAVDAPAAFPLRPIGEARGSREPPPQAVLVSAVDGTQLGTYGAAERLVVEVVGDVALVAASDEPLGPGSGASWDVRVLDARNGQQRDRLGLVSAEAPRLLGTFEDGTVAIGTRSGREVTVHGVPRGGPAQRLAQVEAARTGDTVINSDSPVLVTVGLAGDRLLVLTHDAEHLAALDSTGVVTWNAPTQGASTLAVGDGHVALVSDDPARPTRVLRADDGEAAVTVPPPIDGPPGHEAWTPVAVLAGHVGLGSAPPSFGPLQVPIDQTGWHDLATGEPQPVEELFEPYLGRQASNLVGRMWVLHGTARPTDDDGPGEAFPVLSRGRDGAELQLLDPEGEVDRFVLDVPDQDAGPRYFTEVAGVSTRHVAVFSQGFEDRELTATHLVDRVTGDVTVVPDLIGFALRDDLLVGLVPDRDEWFTGGLVGVDPATGERQWEVAADEPYRLAGGRTLVDDDLLVAATELGVTAIRLQDGRTAWTHVADAELATLGALSPAHVVLATTDGEVVALDRTDGTERWRASVGSPVASLTAAGDDVLVGTVDGVVVHLGSDGEEVQRVAVGTRAVAAVAALGDTVVAVADGVVTGLRVDGTGITQRDEVDLP